MKVERLTNY